MPPTKQVIVLQKSLNMRRGKMVAQGAHASLAVFSQHMRVDEDEEGTLVASFPLTAEAVAWFNTGFKKICVSVDSEAELLSLFERAKAAGLPCALIRDNGLTEFAGVPTYTAVAIGPAPESSIDPLTRHLPLL